MAMCAAWSRGVRCDVARRGAARDESKAMHSRLFRRLGEIRYRHFFATPAQSG